MSAERSTAALTEGQIRDILQSNPGPVHYPC
jgi:hypothetical protein